MSFDRTGQKKPPRAGLGIMRAVGLPRIPEMAKTVQQEVKKSSRQLIRVALGIS